MSDAPPLLLVALPKSERIDGLVHELLPGIPWAYLDSDHTVDSGSVRAMLVENFRTKFPGFDARTVPNLQFVQQLSTGLDRFPFEQFPSSVSVAGNVGGFAPFVAEHAVALALAAARDLRAAGIMVEAGKLRPAPRERTLVDATAVILGYGSIGRAIAERLVPFGARIVGLNRDGSSVPGAEQMFPAVKLREAVGAGSFVFEVRPLTEVTRGTIGAAELAAMRPDAVFVNVGRAATVDQASLYDHLRTHPEFRAAFDVWWDEDFAHERLVSRYPFAKLPNFYGTPHVADAFAAAKHYALRVAIENLARFFRDGRPRFVAARNEYGPASRGTAPPTDV